jgi:hypothetical protein
MLNPIPSFQEFEENSPLNQKITPQIAESVADYFSQYETVNEAGFFDSIKNTLSKTFLGSLSYINIIDRVRTEVLKLEKETITKRYAFQDEMESLRRDLKVLSSSGNESSISNVQKTIDLKKKEHETYEKMTSARIEKALSALKDAIKGNKRRKEYYDAGKAQDELDLAEFEYSLAKKRSSIGSEELKKLESDLQKAKKEALEAQDSIKKSQEESTNSRKKAEEEGIKTLDTETPDFQKSLKTFKGTRSLILYLKKEKDKLEDKLHDVKNDNLRSALKNSIRKVAEDLKLAEKVLTQHKDKKLMTSQTKYEQMILSGARELSINDTARKKALKKSESTVKGTKGKDGNPKTGEATKHQQKAKTTSIVNKSASATQKNLN